MNRFLSSIFIFFAGAVVFIGTVFLLWILFLYLPLSFAADAQCLKAGYPQSRVTWNFERYCINLDGTVTIKVDNLTGIESDD